MVSSLFVSLLLNLLHVAKSGESAKLAVGDIICEWSTTTKSSVNYYTCTELADKYGTPIEDFFKLNPTLNPECDNIQPNTQYCVIGSIEVPISKDGFCGPQHGNTTCPGQCCNSETWKCGEGVEDCQAGICFSGACKGFPSEYSLDGRCGTQNSDLLCANKWGDCCNAAGTCGTGDAFCGMGNCQSGKCIIVIPGPPVPSSTTLRTTTAAPIPTPTQGSISPDGSCGGNNKYKCAGSTFGDCCSSSGFCGSTTGHCSAGCQVQFGTCTAADLSPDGTCGGTNKYKCKGSSFGDCCSSSGFCGSSTTHCGAGCQLTYGTCTTSDLSPDGSCGGTNKYKCKGSSFGDCCSSSGFCGSTTGHCGSGCQLTYGTCTASDLSPDGTCGGTNKYKCKGSSFGDCCSGSGFCGSSTDHCGSGCQLTYGTCAAVTSTATPPKPTGISTDGTCGGSKGLKCQGSGLGECCSSGGFCGSTVQHCAQGCQKTFSSACLTTNVPSLNGECGSTKGGYTCAGGPFAGNCCSAGGFCGTTDAHCKTGCQKTYGTCK